MADKSIKDQLLELSEKVVDLSEEMETAESANKDRTYASLAKELRMIGDEVLAIQELAKNDDLAYSQFIMGSICALLGYWSQAEEEYRKALKHWPDHIGILNELFDALVQQKKYQDAKEIIELSIKYGGETPIIMQNYAAIMVHLHQLDQAKIIMMNCIAKFPDDLESKQFLHQLEHPGITE